MESAEARKLPVAVVGATGYAGVETVRLLAGHPRVDLTYLASHSQAGQPLGASYRHLGALGDVLLQPVDAAAIAAAARVVFLALPARAALELAPRLLERGCRVLDLGPDFRLRDAEAYARHYGGAHAAPDVLARAVYGLAELHTEQIETADLVGVPGCYPTAALLALWPALAEGWCAADDLIVDAKSGVSGAGRGMSLTTHFCEADESVLPYNLGGAHRHTAELDQELSLAAGREVAVSFNPHLIPQTRGLLATCYARLVRPVETAEVLAAYRDFYRGRPFVRVLDDPPATKLVTGSNVCAIGLRVDARSGRLIACGAIDNLMKGAAGQGVQDLNLMQGWEETLGLSTVGLYP